MTVYQYIAKLADGMGSPSQDTAPRGALASFGEGIDLVDGYLDDLSQLKLAVESFRETRSQVLFAAGVAYAIIAAACRGAHTYEDAGLTVAQEWLNRAAGAEEHCPEV